MELAVYVEAGCHGCARAQEIVEVVRERFQGLTVRVIDLASSDEEAPEVVFAVPTFLLNGRVVSLGNPDLEDLCEKVAAERGSRLST